MHGVHEAGRLGGFPRAQPVQEPRLMPQSRRLPLVVNIRGQCFAEESGWGCIKVAPSSVRSNGILLSLWLTVPHGGS